MLIIPLTFICAFLERNITLYVDRIEFGKTAREYNDIRSFEIGISNSYPEGTPVLTLYHKEALVFFGSPIVLGISHKIDTDKLYQTLLNKIPEKNQPNEISC